MDYDKIPAAIAAMTMGVLPNLPGPTRDEWSAAAFGVVALVIREIVYWFRNRRA